ncbi:phosphoribosylanthranilate isomerase [Aminipila butyrica]|uniref:N-(5'-phosphoribosyl)anthranilate isomerase n=1 Tax=Aminipila butyrica TaxID=433296 RepID=A0A858BVQ0_9FIRM|nr:phosphoribosylanthranilate isomerase [Aminipila butyrica]QIB69145.1 phosphoribosylanthranilate isomerase [Aminipila butyrica]
MTKIKICGLSKGEHAAYVNEAMADYAGFVFAKSRRQVSFSEAAVIRRALRPEIAAVGVFVDEEPERVSEAVQAGIIDLVQLHGQENEEYLQQLRRLVSVPIIQAVKVRRLSDIEEACSGSADFLLLDSGAGGSGEVFDWNLVHTITKPFFLAGGINSQNVEQGIRLLRPYGVDVSSGVETTGEMDRKKVLELVRRVRHE